MDMSKTNHADWHSLIFDWIASLIYCGILWNISWLQWDTWPKKNLIFLWTICGQGTGSKSRSRGLIYGFSTRMNCQGSFWSLDFSNYLFITSLFIIFPWGGRILNTFAGNAKLDVRANILEEGSPIIGPPPTTRPWLIWNWAVWAAGWHAHMHVQLNSHKLNWVCVHVGPPHAHIELRAWPCSPLPPKLGHQAAKAGDHCLRGKKENSKWCLCASHPTGILEKPKGTTVISVLGLGYWGSWWIARRCG